MKFHVGGEIFYTFGDLFQKKLNVRDFIQGKKTDYFVTFTGGGIYSLYKVLDFIDIKEKEFILLPSYLCPTILKPFNALQIKYDFYVVDKTLSINIHDIEKKISSKCKAILFINYFGFGLDSKVTDFFINCRSRGIIIIQDMVQALYSDVDIIGDYCIFSFRKFLPIDVGVVLSNKRITNTQEKVNYKYIVFKRLGQICRYLTYTLRIDLTVLMLMFFKFAEKEYYNNFEYAADKISFYFAKQKKYLLRKENYIKLLNEFGEIALIKKIDDGVIPLGFPIVLKNRDFIRKKLREYNIFCPVHWVGLNYSDFKFEHCKFLSENILTLPLHEGLYGKKFDIYITILKEIIWKYI